MNKEKYLFALKQNISELHILFTVKNTFFYQQTLTMHESAKDYFRHFFFIFFFLNSIIFFRIVSFLFSFNFLRAFWNKFIQNIDTFYSYIFQTTLFCCFFQIFRSPCKLLISLKNFIKKKSIMKIRKGVWNWYVSNTFKYKIFGKGLPYIWSWLQ